MKFPSIKSVTDDLMNLRGWLDRTGWPDPEPGCEDYPPTVDVRLQVYPDGAWAIRWGLSDYDFDHRGAWGASCIAKGDTRKVLESTARDMLEQAREDASRQAFED